MAPPTSASFCDQRTQSLALRFDNRIVVCAHEERHELVAADAPHRIAMTEHVEQRTRHLFQNPVAML